MKKNGFAPIIILVIVILGVVGYFGYKGFPLKHQLVNIFSPSPSTVSSPTATWKTYINTKYNYSIKYPDNWTFREFPDTQTGAGFRLANEPNDLNHEYISIDISNRSSDLQALPFEEYVKMGAIEEIQNFMSLASIEKIVTEAGLVGYKTTWNVQMMGEVSGKTSISSPITYFDTKNAIGDTIQVKGNINYLDIYNQMLLTFKFIK